LQHQEWVKFQQAISVDGFQTGQVVQAKVLKKKTKGGKQVRRKREREEALMNGGQDDQARLKEKFPAIRYSEEETAKLLAEAFGMLPERAGKRGTRNLKRQKRRWFLVRKIHAREKKFRGLEHERKMEIRHEKRQAVMAVKESAPGIKQSDADYQQELLERWAATMIQDQQTAGKEEVRAFE
jgi:hypothetical protein